VEGCQQGAVQTTKGGQQQHKVGLPKKQQGELLETAANGEAVGFKAQPNREQKRLPKRTLGREPYGWAVGSKRCLKGLSKKQKKKSCLALDLEKFETLSNLETKNAKLLMIKTWKRNATLAKGKKQDLLKELRKW